MSDIKDALRQIRSSIEAIEQRLESQPEDTLVDYERAAQFLDVSTKTVREFVARGEIAIVDMGTKLLRVEMSELRRFKNARRRTAA